MPLLEKLNSVAERRQANWNAYPKTDGGLTFDLTSKLDELWAEVRLMRAREHSGGSNAEIIKRARVEREIERLASVNGS